MTDPIYNFRPASSVLPPLQQPLQHKTTVGGLHFGADSKRESNIKNATDGDTVEISKKPQPQRTEKKRCKPKRQDQQGPQSPQTKIQNKTGPKKLSGQEGKNNPLAGTILDVPTSGSDTERSDENSSDVKTSEATPSSETPKSSPKDDRQIHAEEASSDTGKSKEAEASNETSPNAESSSTQPPKKRSLGFYLKSAVYTTAILGLTLLSFGVVPVATLLGLKVGSGIAASVAVGVGAAFLRDSIQRKYGHKEGEEFDNYVKKEKVMGEISNWVEKLLKRVASIKVPLVGWNLLNPEHQADWVRDKMQAYHAKVEDRVRGLIDRFYDEAVDPDERETAEHDLDKFSEWRTEKGLFYAVVAYAGVKARHILVRQLPAQIMRLRNKGWYGFAAAAVLTFLAETVFNVKLNKNKKPEPPASPSEGSTPSTPQAA